MDDLSIIVVMTTLICTGIFAILCFGSWMNEKSKRMECERNLGMKDEIIKQLQNKSVCPTDDTCEYLKTKKKFMEIRCNIEKLELASDRLAETLKKFKVDVL